jgi:hypothetical protein
MLLLMYEFGFHSAVMPDAKDFEFCLGMEEPSFENWFNGFSINY